MPIYVDNRPFPEAPHKNLLEHCLSLGVDIPYFCWHPALGSVGACRQCAVKQYKDDKDDKGSIVMACMTPAAEGTRIDVDDQEARHFRAEIIEWLMTNHPHDCPVCEEGGECHLQDMTVMSGHNYRRFRGKKRTFRNQNLGPFIGHEMNRCIACYRCIRFYREYAGGKDLEAFASHHHVYFGRHEEGVLESEFSGNLVEVCPTGVFTDKTFSKHYVRKWDLQSAPSICVHCGVGCNTTPGERYGVLRRIQNRYNGEVNNYFLCDRGRFGYDFVNSERRIRRAFARGPERDGEQTPLNTEDALSRAASAISESDVIGIGSPRASLEANFALRRLVGEENFYLGLSGIDDRLLTLALEVMTGEAVRLPTLKDVAEADAIVVLGEDLTNTAPRSALAVREAAHRRRKTQAEQLGLAGWHDAAVRNAVPEPPLHLYVAAPARTKLEELATEAAHCMPEDIARLGFAVAHALDSAAPEVAGLSADETALAARIAASLRAAERPLIVTGTGARSGAVIQAASNIARALRRERSAPVDLLLALPECNSLGLKLIGGRPLGEAFQRARAGGAATAIVLENDLHRRAAPGEVERFIADLGRLLVIDHVEHDTARAADVLLPAATFAEGNGTFVNNEGRAQRFFQVFVPKEEIREAWRWLQELGRRTRGSPDEESLDELIASCAQARSLLRSIVDAAPSARFRVSGERIDREPPRYSGRTAMHADADVREPKPPEDPSSALSFSMEGYHAPGKLPSALIPFFWAPGWNSVQSVRKYQDLEGAHLRNGDPGVRLLDAAREQRPDSGYFSVVPESPARHGRTRRIVAVYEIYGSEELSVLAPAVAERAPAPYVAVHPADAETLGLAEAEPAEIALSGRSLVLPTRIEPGLARGAIGLPAGLPGLGYVEDRSAAIGAPQ